MKLVLIACLFFAGSVYAQDKDPAAIVELGGAASRSLTGGGSSFGPNLNGMPSIRETLDSFEKSRVYGRSWAGVDSHDRARQDDERTWNRSSGRFHVLAVGKA